MSARIKAAFAILAVLGVAPASAFALPHEESERASPLEQAREESSVRTHPRERFALPAGTLRLSEPELLASTRQRLELSVTLERDVAAGTLELTLPRLWVSRADASGLRFARVPATGTNVTGRARARRSERVVSFDFDGGRAGDVARFTIRDSGIPAGTYRLPFRWRERGAAPADGTATVIFFAPTRETQTTPGAQWSRLASPGMETNATDDAVSESETFMTVVPGNRKRFIVGANGGVGFNAWVTNDGGQTFTKAAVPTTTDAPGEAGPETSDLCCDPMSAADAAGNLWYGGLSLGNGGGQPSRIVVNRIAPGATRFQSFTVGLPQGSNGTQDKPMMTIDNSASSPRFGRLYVVWDEPSGGGVDVVISHCDTRPGGSPNPANCDNADNWTAPVSVTPSNGSYIYADVAAAPDGTVNVVWWDYSATNAIRGDSCGPAANCASAASWGTPQTIATLDATGGKPVPFACPILAQPGGRAAPSPQIDVDHSGGANHGRVYVSWGDLRTGSGSTRCADGLTPAATHLTWDSFVASAAGGLPGGASPSPSVGTRLLTDGEGGGQANSDEWFPWLAVDQTTGQAWADFYSTRDDATRRTTHFYARSLAPSGGGHTLGPLTRVSGAASDYSTEPCCTFGNDYGDYTGIDATQGIALPVWSDKRSADGEAYTFVRVEAALVAAGETVDDSAGDNDGFLEPGESFALTQGLSNLGSAAAAGVTSTLSESLPQLSLSQAASGYPDIAVNATEGNTTPFTGALDADAVCGARLPMSLEVNSADGSFTIPVGVHTGQPGPLQTFSASPDPPEIPDYPAAGLSSDLGVSGVAGRLNDLDVRVNISHPFDRDLTLSLRAPDGTVITLVQNRGGSGDNFTNTDLDDEAATAISAGAAPFTGSFRPEQPLSTFDGMDPNGTWTLVAVDSELHDAGTLNSWRLSVHGSSCSSPPAAPSLSATNPGSPAADTTPLVLGSAPGGSTVQLYTGGSCTGAPAATGSAAELASPGIEITVPSGSTTEIRATATLGGLESSCSAPLSYVATAVAAPGPSPPGTTPPGATPDTSVTLTLSARATQRALRNRGLRVRVSCPFEPCVVAARGRVTIPSPTVGGRRKRIATKSATRTLGGAERARLTLRFSASLRRQIARALRSRRTRGRVRAVVRVTATDAAGNRQTKSAAVRIRR